jgi:hypothetical protein
LSGTPAIQATSRARRESIFTTASWLRRLTTQSPSAGSSWIAFAWAQSIDDVPFTFVERVVPNPGRSAGSPTNFASRTTMPSVANSRATSSEIVAFGSISSGSS